MSKRFFALSSGSLFMALLGLSLMIPYHDASYPPVENTTMAKMPGVILFVASTPSATVSPVATSLAVLSPNPTPIPEDRPSWAEALTISDVPHFRNLEAAVTENTLENRSQQWERDLPSEWGVPAHIPVANDVSEVVSSCAQGEGEGQTASSTYAPPVLVGKALVVDQDAQMLRVYEDGIEIRTLSASTGVSLSYTPAFRGHVGRYAGTIYGYGSLADNAWYVFTARGNIYIHGAPYRLSEGVKMYEGLEFLGVQPSSHGCIRLYPADAEWLAQWDPRGVPILITPPNLD